MAIEVYPSEYATAPLQYARDTLADYYGDYVFFRASNSQYVLIMGDINFTTGAYSDCTVISYTAYTDPSYGRYYVSSLSEDQYGIFHNQYNTVIYGSESGMPKLVANRGDVYEIATAFGLCVFFGSWVLHNLFSSISRR